MTSHNRSVPAAQDTALERGARPGLSIQSQNVKTIASPRLVVLFCWLRDGGKSDDDDASRVYVANHQLINSSARRSMDCGTLNPIACAARKFSVSR